MTSKETHSRRLLRPTLKWKQPAWHLPRKQVVTFADLGKYNWKKKYQPEATIGKYPHDTSMYTVVLYSSYLSLNWPILSFWQFFIFS